VAALSAGVITTYTQRNHAASSTIVVLSDQRQEDLAARVLIAFQGDRTALLRTILGAQALANNI
jgi:hypothetical protein